MESGEKEAIVYRIYRLDMECPCYGVTMCTRDGGEGLRPPEVTGDFIERLFVLREMELFLLFSFVVLYDHCHLLVSPIPPNDIEDCLRVLRDYSPSGDVLPFWDGGRFYSEVRSDEEFRELIEKNIFEPVKIGLSVLRGEYPFCSAHVNFRSRTDLFMTGYFPKFFTGSSFLTLDK